MEEISSQRLGNLQRANWREKCRQILADHIRTKLGCAVDPDQVRLKPDPQDGYRWEALPERQHLFAKPLSKHSVGAYMELCREVGKSFEAVRLAECDVEVELGDSGSKPIDSFASIIELFREENSQLQKEVFRYSQQAQEQLEKNGHLEAISKMLEKECCTAKIELEEVKQQKCLLIVKIKVLTKRMDVWKREAGKALMVLRKMDRCARNTWDTEEGTLQQDVCLDHPFVDKKTKFLSKTTQCPCLLMSSMQTRDAARARLGDWIESALLDILQCWVSSISSYMSDMSSLETYLTKFDDLLSQYLQQHVEQFTRPKSLPYSQNHDAENNPCEWKILQTEDERYTVIQRRNGKVIVVPLDDVGEEA